LKKILISLLLVFPISFMFSQTKKARLFFKDKTSLKGYAKITKNDKILFKISPDEKPDKWGELMVKSLLIEEFGFMEEYRYIEIDSKKPKKLLQIVAEGKVNLFADIEIHKSNRNYTYDRNSGLTFINSYDKNNNYSEKVRYYVKKKNEKYPTKLFGSGGFRNKAKIYFSDCTGVKDKLSSKEFDVHNPGEMVNYYNDFCSD